MWARKIGIAQASMKDRKYFLDTNILVYAHDSSVPKKQAVCQALLCDGIEKNLAVISTQVLSEFVVTVTKKISPPMTFEVLREELELLEILNIQSITSMHVHTALEIQRDNMTSYWDALIVAAAGIAQCSILYSEDLNHGQKIAGVEICNPFI